MTPEQRASQPKAKTPRFCEVEYLYEGTNKWMSYSVGCQSMSLSFCRGIIHAEHQRNSCRPMRILNYLTKEVIETFDGFNRELSLNGVKL